jgi:hypothetical protein
MPLVLTDCPGPPRLVNFIHKANVENGHSPERIMSVIVRKRKRSRANAIVFPRADSFGDIFSLTQFSVYRKVPIVRHFTGRKCPPRSSLAAVVCALNKNLS